MTSLYCGRCGGELRRVEGELVCLLHERLPTTLPENSPTQGEVRPAPRSDPRPPMRRPHVATERVPLGWTGREPHLTVLEWRAIGTASMSPAEAGRHVLVLGETGSGKTQSGVLPFARAWLRYPGRPNPTVDRGHGLRPSMLVVDAKRELGDALAEADALEGLGREIVRLDSDRPWAIWLSEGIDPLDATAEQLTSAIFGLSGAHAHQKARSREAFFYLQAEWYLQALIEADIELYRLGGAGWVTAFWAELARRFGEKKGATLPDDGFLLRHLGLLSLAMRTSLTGCFDLYAEVAETFGVPPRVRADTATLGYMPNDTYGSVVATARGMTQDVTDAAFLRHVWIDPFSPPPADRFVSIRRSLERGACLVYSPLGASPAESAVGRALKSMFFRACYTRADQRRPAVYICDEAHRFVTSDPVSGEQAFLDPAVPTETQDAVEASCLKGFSVIERKGRWRHCQ